MHPAPHPAVLYTDTMLDGENPDACPSMSARGLAHVSGKATHTHTDRQTDRHMNTQHTSVF